MKKLFLSILLLIPSAAFSATTTTFLESGSAATQDLSFWSANAGTWASDGTIYYNGGRSLKGSSGAGNSVYSATSPSGILLDSGSQMSFYYRFDNAPTGNVTMLRLDQAGGNSIWSIQHRTTNVLGNVGGGAGNIIGTTVLSPNTWYRISVSYFITNATTFTFKVYINGNLDTTNTNSGTLGHITTDNFILGFSAAGGGANHNTWYSNIYVATGGASAGSQPDTGNILVTAKRSFANGTTNGFTTQVGAGGSSYGTGHAPQVNERPLSATNGWSSVSSAQTEEYNIESLNVGDVALQGATIVDEEAWVYASATNAETGTIIYNGSSSNISLTSTNTLFTKIMGSTSYPAGTGSDIGMTSTAAASTVALYEAGILIAYKSEAYPPGSMFQVL